MQLYSTSTIFFYKAYLRFRLGKAYVFIRRFLLQQGMSGALLPLFELILFAAMGEIYCRDGEEDGDGNVEKGRRR